MQSQQWLVMGTICLSLLQIFMAVESFPVADKITTEAEPASKPLVLWLNGGPGCSSVGAGAFLEHGPFKPSGDGLLRNEYSWNKEANMLYLESPAGVGFSYSAHKSFYNNVNDEITAQDSLIFLQRWFLKFPEYQKRDFFIGGESYAGHYVPQLAQLIVQSKVKFNLKGIAIGNPLLEFNTDFNSVDEYYWSHGLISDGVYELLTQVCNGSEMSRGVIRNSLSRACIFVAIELQKELENSVDMYNVIGNDHCLENQSQTLYQPLRSRIQALLPLHSQPNALGEQQVKEKEDVVCPEKTIAKYLNRKDVQQALHARLVGVNQWTLCSKVPQYDSRDREIPTINVVGSLVRSGIRALVYSGDQDSVLPFTGTRKLVNKLAKALKLKATVPYRPWFEENQVVGGWTQVYGNLKLSFATIRGASHTAPETQPQRSFALFKAFLAGKPLPTTS
ncbi:hypothetical protein SLA2020_433280 [Shorea laevis]